MVGTRKREYTGQVPMGRLGDRPFWVLSISVLIRAVHQVGAAVYLTSFLVEEMSGPPLVYLVVAVVSGVALLFTEGLRHRQIYRELSGVSTLIKILLLGFAYHGYLPAAGAVLTAFMLASICSHVPKSIRHRLLY